MKLILALSAVNSIDPSGGIFITIAIVIAAYLCWQFRDDREALAGMAGGLVGIVILIVVGLAVLFVIGGMLNGCNTEDIDILPMK